MPVFAVFLVKTVRILLITYVFYMNSRSLLI